MDHINLFQTNVEFLSAYTNDYVEPWVSFTMENSGMSFNKSVQPHDYSQDYLTFEVISGGTISSLVDGVLLSKDNGENWDTEITGLTSGDKVIAKGNVHQFGGNSEASFDFGDTRINVCGNIMSIYDSQNFRTITALNYVDSFEYLFLFGIQIISAENLVLPATTLSRSCYCAMFQGCTSLTTAPVLPAATLAEKCYTGMFSDCSSLTSAQELPATTLASECYSSMFYGCTSLTTAPELPATTLTNYCYRDMFNGCRSLNYIKCLATDISANDCTANWINGVAATGTFVKNPNMSSWTTGTGGIPTNWTVEDAS